MTVADRMGLMLICWVWDFSVITTELGENVQRKEEWDDGDEARADRW